MSDWTEQPPERLGVDPSGLARVLDLVRARGAVAQLCVLRHGKVVLDRCVGCQSDSLFWIFSTSKPFVALSVHLLAERGELSLDEPVASYWPRFGQRGKGSITVRHVLQHRAGIPVVRGAVGDALAMTDWDRSIRNIERAHPSWSPGQVPAYHIISYGFILGELVRRVTGAEVPDFLATQLLDPLGLRDVHLGLPEALWQRHVPVRGSGPTGWARQVYCNRRTTRRAVIPSAGVSATARDVARFYLMLLRGGELDGVRVLRPATIDQARQLSSDDEVDRFFGKPVRWAHGFQLGGPRQHPGMPRTMGQLSSRETFGHNGSDCCLAWADPMRQLVFVYLTNLLTHGGAGARHQSRVSDALLAACD